MRELEILFNEKKLEPQISQITQIFSNNEINKKIADVSRV